MLPAELDEVVHRPKFRRWFTVQDADDLLQSVQLLGELTPDPPVGPGNRSAVTLTTTWWPLSAQIILSSTLVACLAASLVTGLAVSLWLGIVIFPVTVVARRLYMRARLRHQEYQADELAVRQFPKGALAAALEEKRFTDEAARIVAQSNWEHRKGKKGIPPGPFVYKERP